MSLVFGADCGDRSGQLVLRRLRPQLPGLREEDDGRVFAERFLRVLPRLPFHRQGSEDYDEVCENLA